MQVVVQNMLGLVGIRLASVPRRMADKDVTLRWYRFTDLPRLHALVTTEVLRQVRGTIDTDIPSFSAFCVWMLTTFPLAYIIEVGNDGGRRVVGFVGIYDLTLRHRLWIALAVFRPEDRRHGYGRQALSLLLRALHLSRLVSKVYVDVLTTNQPSLHFFTQLGFVPCKTWPEHVRLVKDVTQPRA